MALILALRVLPDPVIDTDLADVSPELITDEQSKLAMDTLRNYAEKRIIVLLRGSNEDAVLDAEDQLRAGLAEIDDISVLPGNHELLDLIVAGLSPYRFSLQTVEQTKLLSELSSQQLAERALNKLHQSEGQSGILEFEKDPLSWHSETLLAILEQLRTGGGAGDDDGLSHPTHIAIVSVNIAQGALNVSAQEKLLGQLNILTDQIQTEFEVQLERSGIFFFAADAASNAKRDISTISIGSSIGIVLLLLLAFGSLRTLVLPVLSVLLGVGFAFLVTHTVYGNVHVLTIVFGASLIGVAIDYSLHYFYHQAAVESVATHSGLIRALQLSLLTSLIGYSALSFSSLEALQKIAVFSCCGLLMAWLCVLSFGDFFTPKILSDQRFVITSLTSLISCKLAKFSQKTALAISFLLLLTAGLILTIKQPFSDDPRVFFKPAKELLESEQQVARIANDYEPGRYLTIVGSNLEQVYTRHSELVTAVDAASGIDRTALSSLLALVPPPASQAQSYQQQAKLYSAGGAADEFVRLLPGAKQSVNSVSSEYSNAAGIKLAPHIVADLMGESLPPFWLELPESSFEIGTILNFVLIRKGFNPDVLELIANDINGVTYTNTVAATQQALSVQRLSASAMLLVAYALISLLILFRYRSIRALWMVLVPASSSAAVVVICFAAGLPLNLFHVMALFLVLGFGMDYTIFIKELGSQPSVTLPAILLSALTSILSFGLLSLSSIPLVFSFGISLLIGNFINLIAAFIVTAIVHQSEYSNQL